MNVNMGAPGLYHTPQWNLGFFHESNFNITDRLTATLGLRYDLMHTAIHYDASAYMQMNANVMGQLATFVLDSSCINSSIEVLTSEDFPHLLGDTKMTLMPWRRKFFSSLRSSTLSIKLSFSASLP